MINVSKPYLPKLSEYNKYLKKIWKSHCLTNDGPLVQELEKRLQDYWKVKHVVCVSSGTVAIQIAINALGIRNEIYICPFSFVATASVPLWLEIMPIFVDRNKEYKSPALVTHIYGKPYITKAKPVIYDASHAFATQYKGKSIMHQGDVSIISFHATKIFHTVEGGAVVTNNKDIAEKARYMRNFGYKDQYSFQGVGINGKMSEFHAAMGLCNLKHIDKVINKYKKLVNRYNKGLNLNHFDYITYYPIFFRNEEKLIKAVKRLNKHGIYPRRYFYPALNRAFSLQSCPIAEDNAKRVLCLPLYYELTNKEQDKIISLINQEDLI